ncbi:Alpha/beta hydrolase fold-1 [Sporodiniella umbellata]|nr:Alpha/beta hydrolase fold-1 [Sporodiniella umbellata]
MYLTPTSSLAIPSSPFSEGWETQKLAVDIHEYPSKKECQYRLAFLFTHATGFVKEVYHPVIQRLAHFMRSQEAYNSIDIHIISFDARFHGESARINHGYDDKYYGWTDIALDIRQVVDHLKLKENYHQLVGVGHSISSSCMILLDGLLPNTFDSLCLLDAAMLDQINPYKVHKKLSVFYSKTRRDEWPDSKTCYKSFEKNPFWKAFHPEALQNFVTYGTYKTDKGTLKLKCSKEHEYHIYTRSIPGSHITRSIFKNFVTPCKLYFSTDSSWSTERIKKYITQLNLKNLVTKEIKGSHLIPMEQPDAIVPLIIDSILPIDFQTTHARARL